MLEEGARERNIFLEHNARTTEPLVKTTDDPFFFFFLLSYHNFTTHNATADSLLSVTVQYDSSSSPKITKAAATDGSAVWEYVLFLYTASRNEMTHLQFDNHLPLLTLLALATIAQSGWVVWPP